ncbi:MAG: TIGR00282 family metallophosphoesterase [Rhodospirillales bacterium]|jgi:metallophosphoesterase (TIGR00282 family)|nr:TIGR00282 family metallophosphoesterase [Rhodospirillales bacterium]
MRILYVGDVVGRAGRDLVCRTIPHLRQDLGIDFVIVNGENAAHGFGITEKICQALFDAGADAIVTGNHAWDQREIINYIDKEPRLLRPINFPTGTPGRGVNVYEVSDGRRVVVAQAQGRLFMHAAEDPFRVLDGVVDECRLGTQVQAVFVDFHAEGTSEKMALGHFLDGRVSAVVGSHTHVPTADAQILPGGTGYLTDVGMCGDYDSVIGMEKRTATARFTQVLPTDRLEPAHGEATLCGVLLKTDDKSGLAVGIEPVRMGGRLSQTLPRNLA